MGILKKLMKKTNKPSKGASGKSVKGSKVHKGGPSKMKIAAVGAGIAGLVATAYAAYFFLGPKGKKHQQQAKSWIIKMKGDVVEKLETVKDITKPMYHEIINSVAAQYEKDMKAGHTEIAAVANELKKHWKSFV